MSVSLNEILTAEGYDVKGNIDDARWLLGQLNEFDDLVTAAEELIEEEEFRELMEE